MTEQNILVNITRNAKTVQFKERVTLYPKLKRIHTRLTTVQKSIC